jgi:hypothetical protein
VGTTFIFGLSVALTPHHIARNRAGCLSRWRHAWTLSEQTGPPIIPLPIFDIQGPSIRVSGLIVGFDDPEVVGTWDITIQAATPLPGALAMFSGGLGVIGLLGWRGKRNAAALPAF